MSTDITLIVGASNNPERYAFKAAQFLNRAGRPFIPISIKTGKVLGEDILDLNTRPIVKGIHTISMYLGRDKQEEWQSYLLSLEPKRIIFNPGAENATFSKKAESLGIETINACTLVMINTGQY